jgi:chromosomal replication initiator protein
LILVNAIWHAALESIRSRVTRENFATYFEPLRFVSLEEGLLRLEVDDPFFGDWVRDHYADLLRDAASAAAGESVRVEIRVALRLAATPVPAPVEPVRTVAEVASSDRDEPPLLLNPHYTFDTFVVGPSNQFAHAASESVANQPARAYNPLFIYGGTGLGKTHLLHAIAHRILAHDPSTRVAYVSAEEFTNQVVKGISRQEMDKFRERYRAGCDVLLVDDVHVLAGRERTQEEFFYTFNALHAAQKQIVLTSDRFPQEMPGLEERLRSRFQWGLIADIKAPELETRVAILKRKAERDRISLTDDIAFFLAQHIWRNVRALEGALIQLAAYASLTGRPMTQALAREALRHLLEGQEKAITVESIQKLVAEHFDVKVTDLRGQRRHRVIAHPRSIAMYLCRKHTQASFPQIGERFGGKDHSTVIAAVRKVEKGLSGDAALRNEVEALERKLPR